MREPRAIRCMWCGEVSFVVAEDIEWDMWDSPDRPYVQRCFPTMSANDRELLVSKTCPICWDEMFSE
jgi:hypothetical protein